MSTMIDHPPLWQVGNVIEVCDDNDMWTRGVVEGVFRGCLSGRWVYEVAGVGYYADETRAAA